MKEGDSTQPENRWLITLHNADYKILSNFLCACLSTLTPFLLHPLQMSSMLGWQAEWSLSTSSRRQNSEETLDPTEPPKKLPWREPSNASASRRGRLPQSPRGSGHAGNSSTGRNGRSHPPQGEKKAEARR